MLFRPSMLTRIPRAWSGVRNDARGASSAVMSDAEAGLHKTRLHLASLHRNYNWDGVSRLRLHREARSRASATW